MAIVCGKFDSLDENIVNALKSRIQKNRKISQVHPQCRQPSRNLTLFPTDKAASSDERAHPERLYHAPMDLLSHQKQRYRGEQTRRIDAALANSRTNPYPPKL